jgi:hypothetical protein
MSRLVLVLFLAGCGGAKSGRASSSAEPPPSADVGGLDGRAPQGDPRIVELDEQIAAELGTLGLEAPTDAEVGEAMVAHRTFEPMSGGVADSCPVPPAGAACGDVCTLADSICHNAERICDLADELDGDAWATRRCFAGRLSCERARERCCGC